jgi:hypothetical protein
MRGLDAAGSKSSADRRDRLSLEPCGCSVCRRPDELARVALEFGYSRLPMRNDLLLKPRQHNQRRVAGWIRLYVSQSLSHATKPIWSAKAIPATTECWTRSLINPERRDRNTFEHPLSSPRILRPVFHGVAIIGSERLARLDVGKCWSPANRSTAKPSLVVYLRPSHSTSTWFTPARRNQQGRSLQRLTGRQQARQRANPWIRRSVCFRCDSLFLFLIRAFHCWSELMLTVVLGVVNV